MFFKNRIIREKYVNNNNLAYSSYGPFDLMAAWIRDAILINIKISQRYLFAENKVRSDGLADYLVRFIVSNYQNLAIEILQNNHRVIFERVCGNIPPLKPGEDNIFPDLLQNKLQKSMAFLKTLFRVSLA